MSKPPKPPQIPMFNITSDPLPMQPEMFTILGEIVVHWSRVEGALDTELEMLRRWPVARKLSEVVPHAFKKKLELWRRSIRAVFPKIETYQSYADGVVDAAKKVAKVRNHLIHGTWTLEENEKGEFLVTNYRMVKGVEQYDKLWVGKEVLENLLADARTLSGAVMGFTISKFIHAHHGLLQVDRTPSPDHQAHQTPASLEKPQEPPESSAQSRDD